MATLAPLAASFRAIPLPMPRELPVISACFPFRDILTSSSVRFNENKISYAFRRRGWIGMKIIQSSQNVNVVRGGVSCIVWLGWRLRIPYVHRAPPFSISSSAPDCDRTSLGCNRYAIWTIHRDGIIAEQVSKLSIGRNDGRMTRPSDPKSGNLQAALHILAQ